MSDAASIILVLVLAAVAISAALVFRRRKGAENARQWLLLYRRPLALTLSGALIALTGVGMIVHAKLVSTEVVDLAAAEAGESIGGGYVVVEGYARPDAPICNGSDCYTPVTSTRDGQRVAVLTSGPTPASGSGRWSGFVTRSNETGYRRSIEAAGLEPAEDFVRILGETKEERAIAGSWVALAGLGLLIAGMVWLRLG